jgi:hypothetical protein
MLFRNLYGLSCLAVILGIYVRLSGSPRWGDVLFLVAGLLLFERALLWRVRAASVYRSDVTIREPVELRIEESNLVRTSAAGSEEIRWANILACHETKNLFLLQLSSDYIDGVPKRAFSPGDLFRFQELRQKELIVKTTRENPDAVLLKFVVSWGLIAIAVMALFIGYAHNFFTQLPRGVPGNQYRADAKSEPARPAELRGRGSVYVVPLGPIKGGRSGTVAGGPSQSVWASTAAIANDSASRMGRERAAKAICCRGSDHGYEACVSQTGSRSASHHDWVDGCGHVHFQA